MRGKTLMLILLFLFTGITWLKAEETGLKVGVDYRLTFLKSAVEYKGDKVKLVGDLKLPSRKNIPAFNLAYWYDDRNGFIFTYWSASYKGDSEESFEFGDTRFTTDIQTKLKTTFADLLYSRMVWEGITTQVFLNLGIKYADINMEVKGTSQGKEKEETVHVYGPIPQVGVKVAFPFTPDITLSGEVNGIALGNASMWEGKVSIGGKFAEGFGLEGGYGVLGIRGKSKDFKVRHSVEGFYLQFKILF